MSKSKHPEPSSGDEEEEKVEPPSPTSAEPEGKRRKLSAGAVLQEGDVFAETDLISTSTSAHSLFDPGSSVDPDFAVPSTSSASFHIPAQSERGDGDETREDVGGKEERDYSHNRNFFCTSKPEEEEDNESVNQDPLSHIDEKDQMFWGPYLSERQWGTVREDFSEDDSNWVYVTYEKAIDHAYVSGEDGLLGVSDKHSLFCASVALWNGKDPIIKERLFGLTGTEGNHGEDVKECYYYLDSLPDHSYMRGLYKYPQTEFPYQYLRDENGRRSFHDPEFELTDTGVFNPDRGYWDIMFEYAKLDNLGLACHIEVVNNGPHKETLHVCPQFYFRHVQKNEPVPAMDREPIMKSNSDGSIKVQYHLGEWRVCFPRDPTKEAPILLFTNNASGDVLLNKKIKYTKGAFQKYIVEGKKESVNPLEQGTKSGAYYKMTIEPGGRSSIYWKLDNLSAPSQMGVAELKDRFGKKRREVQAYYQAIMPGWPEEHRNIGAQAMAGLHWSKQFYVFDVKNWLEDFRRRGGNKDKKQRNSAWSHVHNHHIILMPDKWEFPWYAGWDLMVQAVLYARYSAPFAKHQITTFLSDNYMHPQGKLPGCEFELDDINPPLQAWAVLKIFYKDPSDLLFLRKCFHRLLLNYNWWMNQEFESTGLFGRGFLGMDNISVVDRSGYLPDGWYLVQADFSGWMACYSMWMLQIAIELGQKDPVYCDMIHMFLRHFISHARAINRPIGENGLWHEEDRFLYDVFYTPWGPIPIQLRSLSGLVPLLACSKVKMKKLSTADICMDHYIRKYPEHFCKTKNSELFISCMCMPRVESVLQRVFSEDEFLAPFGIRSLSKVYEKHPFNMQVGGQNYTVKYLSGESDSGTFGGNSNWRGPVWIFMNWLLLESLDLYNERAGNQMVRLPSINLGGRKASTGTIQSVLKVGKQSGHYLAKIKNLETRLLNIFLTDAMGKRPIHGNVDLYHKDMRWKHLVLFYEYINADTGRGCGASHQTGWTAAIVEIMYRIQARFTRRLSILSAGNMSVRTGETSL